MNSSNKQEEARLRAEAAALYAHYEQVVSGLHEMDGEGARESLDILNEAQMAEMCADGLAEERYDASQLAMAIQEPLSDDPVGPGGATREERWDEPMETGYSPEPPLMDDDDIPF
jgi:hypothetical protein